MVTSFQYLAQVISATDNDWTEVVRNLSWERVVWNRMTRILSREGAEPQVSVLLFKAVVQAVLLFGSETLVVTPRMGRTLGGFRDQVERCLTGRLTRRKPDGNWTYTSAAITRYEAGFQTMEEYIRKLQNAGAQYIATQSLLDLC